jgi:uncharacterized protein (DUF58 family)
LRVKLFCEEKTRTFKVVLTLKDSDTGLDLAGPALEHAVSTAASLAYGLIKQGHRVALSAKDFETVYDNTPAHLQKIMEYLASAGHSCEN